MFIGRKYESQIIQKAIVSQRAELLIIYGRRRVGKSALLKKHYVKGRDLYFEGIKGLPLKAQIAHFLNQFAEQTDTLPATAENWDQALKHVGNFFIKGQHYIVFDEFPWMASNRTELVSLLKYFWDNFWKSNSKLTLCLCGSIVNFMVNHVVHSEALHDRKTIELQIEPLPAQETKFFFPSSRSDFEVAKYLMIFGGIPKYLEQIDSNKSLFQNIDRLCFQAGGFFIEEFDTIFKEQFKSVKTYSTVVRLLSQKSMSQEVLANKMKIKSGGGFTDSLLSLERAGFILKQTPYQLFGERKNKTNRYVLWDEWLRFYFTYMSNNLDLIRKNKKPGFFEKISQNSLSNYWGLNFERLVLKNLETLCEQLDFTLADIINYGPYFKQGERIEGTQVKGLQIDLLIQRRDLTLVIIECKFTENPVGTSVISEFKKKEKLIKIPRNHNIERVLISASGVTSQVEDARFFNHILGLEAVLNGGK